MVLHRTWNPLTLKQTCISVIARHFDRLWGEDFESQFSPAPLRLLYVIGPLDGVSGDILEELLHTLEEKHHLRNAHLHMLLSKQIRHLRFTAKSGGPLVSEALTLASYRCRRLVSLDLTSCRHVSPQVIAQSLASLTSLRRLVLRQTKAKTSVLRSIALTLSHLKHLDLHGCPISNSDALLLCGDGGDFVPVCSKLAWLDVSGTKVELSGCVAVLRTFPELRVLNFPDSVEAVAQLHRGEGDDLLQQNGGGSREDWDEPVNRSRRSNGRKVEFSLPGNQGSDSGPSVSASRGGSGRSTDGGVSASASQSDEMGNVSASSSDSRTDSSAASLLPAGARHKLEALYASALRCRTVDPDSLRLACKLCPWVREVHLEHGACDQDLIHLLALPHLSVLNVSSKQRQPVTFHSGVRPLLLERGSHIGELGLYNVQGVDLGLLGSLCPQLTTLKVVSLEEEADFAQSYVASRDQVHSFKQLRQLTLVIGEHADSLDPSDLLERAGALQGLRLTGSPFTDSRMTEALRAHGFAALKELQVTCDSVTVDTVHQFVTSCPQLTRLTLDGCIEISRRDIDQLKTLIKREKLDITVEWS